MLAHRNQIYYEYTQGACKSVTSFLTFMQLIPSSGKTSRIMNFATGIKQLYSAIINEEHQRSSAKLSSIEGGRALLEAQVLMLLTFQLFNKERERERGGALLFFPVSLLLGVVSERGASFGNCASTSSCSTTIRRRWREHVDWGRYRGPGSSCERSHGDEELIRSTTMTTTAKGPSISSVTILHYTLNYSLTEGAFSLVMLTFIVISITV